MSQVSDVSLANQGFGAFRAELNNILGALNSNHLGNSTPGSITQGTIWIDNTNIGSNSLIMKFYDGSDNISMATIDTANNTIDFLDQSITTPLAVGGSSSAGAEIRLPEDTDNGAHYVALKAPDSLADNLTLTLPTADGSNGQVLTTNGSGQLSFSTASSGATAGFAVAMAIAL